MNKTLISLTVLSIFTLGVPEAKAKGLEAIEITSGDSSAWAEAKALGSIAIGDGASVDETAKGGIALGLGASVHVEGGIALGVQIRTWRPGGDENVQYFTKESPIEDPKNRASWISNTQLGALAIGFDEYMARQIVGVAAGSKLTDAVNVAQLMNLQQYGDETYSTQEQFWVMGERVGVLETRMEALKDGFTIRPKNGYQEIHVRQGDVTMGGNRIQGVGDAVAATDAVNKRQLDNTARSLHKKINDVDKDMKAGVAMALAVAGLPQAYIPGKSMLAMSAGTYQGQSGFALGLSHATENRAWIVKGSATVDTRGNFGGSLGAGYQF